MDLTGFLIQLLNSLQYGLLLFMLAAGLTLIFGIMNVVNLAHGSFYMLGAYLAWALTAWTGSFAVALLLGSVLAVGFGVLIEKALFRFFYDRDHLDQVLLTFGLIFVFEELRAMLWGVDVHVNRSPVEGRIVDVKYRKGAFLVASKEVASVQNEQNVVTVETSDGIQIVYKQIAGLIARRIVFDKQAGEHVAIGERIGLMKFGSRMDVLLGPEWKILVEPGQRVVAGETLLAERKHP